MSVTELTLAFEAVETECNADPSLYAALSGAVVVISKYDDGGSVHVVVAIFTKGNNSVQGATYRTPCKRIFKLLLLL